MPRLGSRVRIPSSAPFFCLLYFTLSPGKSSHSPDFLHYPSREMTQLHIQSYFKLDLPMCQMRPFAAKRGQSKWSYNGHAFCTFCTGKASKYSPSPLFRSVYGAFAEYGHPRGHASAWLPENPFLWNYNLVQRCTCPVMTEFLVRHVARFMTSPFHRHAFLRIFEFTYILLLPIPMGTQDQGSCYANKHVEWGGLFSFSCFVVIRGHGVLFSDSSV